jgi:RecB family exonuclease
MAPKMKGDAFLVKEICRVRLGRFLEKEAVRAVKVLVGVERVFEETLDLAAGAFRFKAKMDRIDQLSDDSFLVVDYKTGSAALLPASPEKLLQAPLTRSDIKASIRSFQLPLYYHCVRKAYPEATVNAALCSLRETGPEEGFHALFDDATTREQRDERSGLFMKSLDAMMAEILDVRVPFRADADDSGYCQMCPFFYLCR